MGTVPWVWLLCEGSQGFLGSVPGQTAWAGNLACLSPRGGGGGSRAERVKTQPAGWQGPGDQAGARGQGEEGRRGVLAG